MKKITIPMIKGAINPFFPNQNYIIKRRDIGNWKIQLLEKPTGDWLSALQQLGVTAKDCSDWLHKGYILKHQPNKQ